MATDKSLKSADGMYKNFQKVDILFLGFASKNIWGYTNKEMKNWQDYISWKWNLVELGGEAVGVNFEYRCEPAHLLSVLHFTHNSTPAVRRKKKKEKKVVVFLPKHGKKTLNFAANRTACFTNKVTFGQTHLSWQWQGEMNIKWNGDKLVLIKKSEDALTVFQDLSLDLHVHKSIHKTCYPCYFIKTNLESSNQSSASRVHRYKVPWKLAFLRSSSIPDNVRLSQMLYSFFGFLFKGYTNMKLPTQVICNNDYVWRTVPQDDISFVNAKWPEFMHTHAIWHNKSNIPAALSLPSLYPFFSKWKRMENQKSLTNFSSVRPDLRIQF